MNKQDFKKKHPDVCIQEITFTKVISHQEIEAKVIQIVEGLRTGLLGYESSGKKLKIFTSYRFKSDLDKMVKGINVLDKNLGLAGTITSDKPFICCGEMCVRVDFSSNSGVFACTYFI